MVFFDPLLPSSALLDSVLPSTLLIPGVTQCDPPQLCPVDAQPVCVSTSLCQSRSSMPLILPGGSCIVTPPGPIPGPGHCLNRPVSQTQFKLEASHKPEKACILYRGRGRDALPRIRPKGNGEYLLHEILCSDRIAILGFLCRVSPRSRNVIHPSASARIRSHVFASPSGKKPMTFKPKMSSLDRKPRKQGKRKLSFTFTRTQPALTLFSPPQSKKRQYDQEVENLERQQKQTIERLEQEHTNRLRDEAKRIKAEIGRASCRERG